jgi:cytoskeletal protein CcmA (bactofilin family)
MPTVDLQAKVVPISSGVVSNNLTNSTIKKDVKNIAKSTPTIIARDLKIEGTIGSSGLVEIEGIIQGTIFGNSVILREEGFINGEITAENLSLRGNFQGKIRAKSISISSKAKVVGEIEYESLSVEDGACIDGQFKKIK